MIVVERDIVTVAGPDAEKYLQGQLSADVARLADGASAWTFLLEPSGKLGFLGRVRRRSAQEFVLDLEPGAAEPAELRLRRFLIRTKVTITTGRVLVDLEPSSGGDLVGWWGDGHHAIVETSPVSTDAAESARISAGWPGGPELVDGVIPGETGCVPVAVSFTKGCYTGQELVARIDSRGNHVPHLLRRIALSRPAVAGAEVHDAEGSTVGSVTSVAGEVALGYLARRVEPGAAVTIDGATARVLPQRDVAPAAERE